MRSRPLLAITMGDPAGVGPEIIVKALSHRQPDCDYAALIIGSERALRRALEFTHLDRLEYREIHSIHDLPDEPEGMFLLNDESRLGEEISLARVDPACGASAYQWLEQAIRFAGNGKVDAIVTAPLHKEALNQAGYAYAGHTEILAELTGTRDYALMLIANEFRVGHVTCHTALRDVSRQITQKRVATVIRLLHQALRRIDRSEPRLAVCALNPHGGEGGLFGDEEIRHIRPAVEQCAAEGIQVEGPMPSDSIYPQMIGGKYNGVVAMYHDQGHIPFKLMNFSFDPESRSWRTVSGVNITLGLPIIRTSVDHGTAFDLAGTGQASERSLLDAIQIATRLASPED